MRSSLLSFLGFCCSFFLSHLAPAQQIVLESYGLEEGLPSLNVYSLHLDAKGYLWAGTPEGLVRYDGEEFTLIPENPRPGHPIMEIWSNGQGKVGFQIAGGEVFHWEHDSTVAYPYNQTILAHIGHAQNRSINATQMDEDGTLHLGFNGLGYLKISPEGDTSLVDHNNASPGYHVRSLNGNLFDFGIPVPGGNIHQLPDLWVEMDGFSFHHRYAYDSRFQMVFLRSCYRLKDGRILVVCGNHLLEIFPDQRVIEHFFPSPIYHIVEDEQGRLIVSYLIGGSQAFTPDLQPLPIEFTQLGGSRIGLFLSDGQGGYWIKSSNQGLYYLRSLDILRYGSGNSGKASQVTAICHDGKGTLYYMTAEGTLLRIQENQSSEAIAQLPQDGSLGQLVQFMCFDTASGNILMASNNNNLLWDGGEIRELPSNGDARSFLRIVDMRDGTFVGLNARTISSFPYGETSDRLPVSIEDQWFIAGAAPDGNGGLWITAKEEVLHYSDNALTIQDLGLPKDQPWVYWEIRSDLNGGFLIGVGFPGLVIHNPEGATNWLGREQGLPEGFTLGAIPMPNGDIWIVQRQGLVRLRKSKSGRYTFSSLNRTHGLITPGIESSLFDGRYIWTHDPKGLLRIDPQRVQLDFPPAPIHISAFELGDSLCTALPPVLDRQHNSITFHFRSLDFRQSGQHLYQYRMPGLEDDWVTTPTNSVRFPQLPPGNYNFQVRASNSQGNWGPIAGQLVRISPAFYETWWFKLILLLLGLFLLLGIFAAVLFRIRKANQIREQNLIFEQQALNAQMNPHFVFNSLNSIQAFIVRNDSRNSIRYLSKFARLMRNSLDASQSRTISLEAEIKLLQHYCELEQLRFGEGFEFEIKCSPNINRETTGLPTYLIQPHVENAIWHGLQHLPEGKTGRLLIEFSKDAGMLSCRISDNGVGRTAAVVLTSKPKEHQSHALQIVKKRLSLLQKIHKNAQFTIEIEDLKNSDGHSLGTLVLVNMSILKLEPLQTL